jgi:hypothetical protein
MFWADHVQMAGGAKIPEMAHILATPHGITVAGANYQ